MLKINKSHVPKIAVDRTIRRGIDLWRAANDNKPCPPHVVKQITDVVHRQATIMNIEREYKEDEARNLKGLY